MENGISFMLGVSLCVREWIETVADSALIVQVLCLPLREGVD